MILWNKFISNFEKIIEDIDDYNKIYKFCINYNYNLLLYSAEGFPFDLFIDEIIKKTRDLKIFNGLLLSKHSIVIKIGKSETIEREYKISQLLSQIPGFIIYLCYFNCTNKIDKIIFILD